MYYYRESREYIFVDNILKFSDIMYAVMSAALRRSSIVKKLCIVMMLHN